jgi:primary-amine oxidase
VVTRYRAGELDAAGRYPNQGRGGDGLPRFAARDEPIVDTDVVLWYTFGITHIPRVEDWPVMPVHRAAFTLVPDAFFARNPALAVPPPSLP